jgi:hypothetical protein
MIRPDASSVLGMEIGHSQRRTEVQNLNLEFSGHADITCSR